MFFLGQAFLQPPFQSSIFQRHECAWDFPFIDWFMGGACQAPPTDIEASAFSLPLPLPLGWRHFWMAPKRLFFWCVKMIPESKEGAFGRIGQYVAANSRFLVASFC